MRRETWILLLGSALLNVGWGAFWSFLGLYLYDLKASYFQIALLDSISALMYLTSRVWGAVSDYYGLRKPFILAGNLLSAIPILLCGFTSSPNQIIGLYAATALSSSVAYPPFLAALTSTEGEEGGILGWYSMLISFGWAVGCFLMGPLCELAGPSAVFTFSSITVLSATLIMVGYPSERRRARSEGLWEYVKVAFSLKFRAPKEFRWVLLSIFIAWFGAQWGGPLIRMRMYDLLERSKVIVGIVWGPVASVLCAVVSPLAGRLADRIGGWRLLQATILLYAVLTPAYAVIHDPILYSALYVVPVWSFFWIGNLATPAQMTHQSVRGEAMGAQQSASNLGIMLGFLGGVFADRFGRELGIVLSSALFVAALLPLILLKRKD